MGIEQLLAIQLDAVRNPDVANRPAGARGTDRLHHRLLRADAFEHGVSADSPRQGFDAGNCFVSMANCKFALNTITKRLLQQFLTWDAANVKRCRKISQPTVFRQLSNSPWTTSEKQRVAREARR